MLDIASKSTRPCLPMPTKATLMVSVPFFAEAPKTEGAPSTIPAPATVELFDKNSRRFITDNSRLRLKVTGLPLFQDAEAIVIGPVQREGDHDDMNSKPRDSRILFDEDESPGQADVNKP